MFSILKNESGKFYVICKYAPLVLEICDSETVRRLNRLDPTIHGIEDKFFEILGVKLPTPVCREKKEMPFKFIEAIITYDCNLSCSYCWQKSEAYQKKKTMGIDAFSRAVRLISEYNKQFDYKGGYRIGYMGGEPLLLSDFIFKAHDIATQLLGACEGNILTNGTLLTEDNCKEIVKRNISVCVSLDGPPAINYRRSSFAETWRGIQNAMNFNVPLSIQSTLSMSQISQGAMKQTALFFLENGLLDFTILLEAPIGNIDDNLLYKEYKSLLLLLVEYAEKTKRVPEIIRRFMHNISNETYSMADCFCRFLYPAGIQVDPYGNVFACEFDRDKYHYGNITQGAVSLEKAHSLLKGISKYNDHVCNNCEYCGICYGYPRLCSLYKKDEKCHMKSFYRACFTVLPERLEKLV